MLRNHGNEVHFFRRMCKWMRAGKGTLLSAGGKSIRNRCL